MTGQEIFRERDGKLAEVWHQEDAPGMLRQLGLEPPTAIMRLAARRSARRYRRELAATGSGDRARGVQAETGDGTDPWLEDQGGVVDPVQQPYRLQRGGPGHRRFPARGHRVEVGRDAGLHGCLPVVVPDGHL